MSKERSYLNQAASVVVAICPYFFVLGGLVGALIPNGQFGPGSGWLALRFWQNDLRLDTYGQVFVAFLISFEAGLLLWTMIRKESKYTPYFVACIVFICIPVVFNLQVNGQIVKCWCIVALLACALADEGVILKLLKITATIGALVAVGSAVLYVIHVGQFEGPMGEVRASGWLGSPNNLYPLMCFATLISFVLFLDDANESYRKYWLGCGIACLIISLLTLSRSSWLLIGSSLPIVLAWKSRNFSFQRLSLVCILGGTLSILVCNGLRGVLEGSFLPSLHSLSSRPRAASFVVLPLLHAPVLGSGYGAYSNSMSSAVQEFNGLVGEPKNLFLNILVEDGILGLTGWALLALMLVYCTCTNIKSNRAVDGLSLAVLVGCGLTGFTDTFIYALPGRFPGTLVLFTILGTGLRKELNRPSLQAWPGKTEPK